MKKFLSNPFLLIVIVFITACSENGPSSTETLSHDPKFLSLSDKIEFLQKYVSFRRLYNELDFAIFFHNNTGGLLSGPSDWDIRIIAQVPKSEITLWTNELHPTNEPEIEWINNLPGPINKTEISTWYKSDNRLLGVDERNAIIVYRNTNM